MINEQITIKDFFARWQMICTFMIIFALLALIISLIIPAKFQSDVSLIVVQKQAEDKVDAFSATKSAEFMSNIFKEAIYTTSFFNAVQEAPFTVRTHFSVDPEERDKEWKKFIDVRTTNNTGILNISVYDSSRAIAQDSAKAIAYVLKTKGAQYHGGGSNIEVRVIDGPNTPLRPTIPHTLRNVVIGIVVGLMSACGMIYFFPTFHFFGQQSFKKQKSIATFSLHKDQETEHSSEEVLVSNHFNGMIEHEMNHDDLIDVIEEEKDDVEENVDVLHNRIRAFHESTAS